MDEITGTCNTSGLETICIQHFMRALMEETHGWQSRCVQSIIL